MRCNARKSTFEYEPAHDKVYNKTYVTNKDSDQPVIYPVWQGFSLIPLWITRPEAIEDTCDQRRL